MENIDILGADKLLASANPVRKRLEAQVLHKRTYGNKLVFLDVYKWSNQEHLTAAEDSRSSEGDVETHESSDWEVVFSFEIYGSDVRSLRKDISPGDVAEFEGSLRACGKIIDAVVYRITHRWQDIGKGLSFNALKAAPNSTTHSERRHRNPAEKVAPSLAPEEVDEGTGIQLCKFWMSNGNCSRSGCGCAHPTGDSWKEARRKYFDVMKHRKASNANPNDPHSAEGKKSHAHRAAVVADWLCSIFGLEELRSSGVVEVAGGRGDLAFELSVKREIPCVVVDPRCPGEEMKLQAWKEFRLSRAQRSWLQSNKKGLSNFNDCQQFVASCALRQCKGFITKESVESGSSRSWWADAVHGCKVVVGLHPDQATGAVVDLALAFDLPFAVAPCCTFADDFPERMLASGAPVRTYDDLVEWLKARSLGTEVEFLPFQGKNLVVFRRFGGESAGQRKADAVLDCMPEEKKLRVDETFAE